MARSSWPGPTSAPTDARHAVERVDAQPAVVADGDDPGRRGHGAALSRAFSANVAPVSATSGDAGEVGHADELDPDVCLGEDPAQLLDLVSVAAGEDDHGHDERLLLEPGELEAAGHAEVEQRVEQRAVEGLALGGALDLDEAAVAGADDVHVGLGP